MDRNRWLRVALVAFGIAFLLVYPLMIVWPSGWAWQPSQHEYEQMIVGIYATLGVFLLRASRQPEAHLSLIWFTVWSSVVHGGIMAVQASVDPAEHGHLPGDVAALLLVAAVLAVLTPRGAAARSQQAAG
jgi:peptidoglycan/LPS O-acetylase OafA/YrhL